jgi:multidrug resistance efflux pump
MNKRRRNLLLLLSIWIFAAILAGLVIWLMILRGPAIMP